MTAPDPLETARPEELVACVRLLSASLSAHRERFGSLPLEDVNPDALESGLATLDLVEEALRVVRLRLAAAAMPVPTAAADLRHQYRISINAPVTVLSDDRGRRATGSLRNISWGGAAVRCADMPGGLGDAVWLLLPSGRGGEIPVRATILRETGSGMSRDYGVRFDSISPQDAARFRRVLEILLDQRDAGGRRAEARLVQRLAIEYGDAGELRATLEDISTGGLSLVVPDALEPGQSLLIVLSSIDSHREIELRARVVRQEREADAEAELYRVALQFEHPGAELRQELGQLIRELPVAGPALRAFAGEP